MSRQPRGPSHPVDDRWRLAVREELARRSMSQTELARAVGATDPTISLLLRTVAECKEAGRKPVEVSRFAVRVSETMGIGLPGPAMDSDLASFLQLAQALRVFDPTFLRRATTQMLRDLRRQTDVKKMAFVPRDFADLIHRLPGSVVGSGSGANDGTEHGTSAERASSKRGRRGRS